MERDRRQDDDRKQSDQGRGWQSETERQSDAGRESSRRNPGDRNPMPDQERKTDDVSRHGKSVEGDTDDNSDTAVENDEIRRRNSRKDQPE